MHKFILPKKKKKKNAGFIVLEIKGFRIVRVHNILIF